MRTTKSSGIEWAEEIPQSWEVKPLFAIGNESRTSNSGGKSDNLLSLSYGEVVEKDINSSDGLLPESFDTYQVIKPNDMVFRFTDLQNDKRSLRSAISHHSGIITSAYMAFTPRDCEPGFLAYLMRSYDLTKVFYAMGSGLRQSLKYSDVKRLPIILPPRQEQRAIVDFLDRETVQIDNLIAKQQQLIATLGERRQTLINGAVWRGLNSSAKFCEHANPRIGPYPAHWVTCRLKDVATVTPSNVDKKSYEDGIPVLLCNYVDVYRNDFITSDLEFLQATATPTELVKFQLKAGWVIITKDSESAEDIGVSTFVPADMEGVVCGYHLSIIQARGQNDGLFLKWFFDSTTTKAFMSERSNGLTRMALGQGAISSLPMVLPPISEQSEIATFIQRKTAGIDRLIDLTSQTILKLKERRQALISAAVTGKIDVRG